MEPTRTREGDAVAKAKGGASRLACAALEAALPRSRLKSLKFENTSAAGAGLGNSKFRPAVESFL